LGTETPWFGCIKTRLWHLSHIVPDPGAHHDDITGASHRLRENRLLQEADVKFLRQEVP